MRKAPPVYDIWKWGLDAPVPEKLIEKCSVVTDVDPSGRFLLGISGVQLGIYQISLPERKCTLIVPDVATDSALFAPDGKSFLYTVESRGQVTVFRQPWRDGSLIGKPQLALAVPLGFPLIYKGGNAYSFSRDLSTIVYVRRSGHADLYLLSQK
jgi:hypothetical protein